MTNMSKRCPRGGKFIINPRHRQRVNGFEQNRELSSSDVQRSVGANERDAARCIHRKKATRQAARSSPHAGMRPCQHALIWRCPPGNIHSAAVPAASDHGSADESGLPGSRPWEQIRSIRFCPESHCAGDAVRVPISPRGKRRVMLSGELV